MLASVGKIKGQKEIIQIRNKRKRKVDDERSSQGHNFSTLHSSVKVSTEGPFQSEFCSCLAFIPLHPCAFITLYLLLFL